MKKSLAILLLLLCLALVAVSCTDGKNEEQTATAAATKTATESAAESATEKTTDVESAPAEMTEERAIGIVKSLPTLKAEIPNRFGLLPATVDFGAGYASKQDDGNWNVRLTGIVSGKDGMKTENIDFVVRATVSEQGESVNGPVIWKKSWEDAGTVTYP